MNNEIYLAVMDKLEPTDNPMSDLLIEAVGNDDGSLRAEIFRIAGDGKHDSLLNAFAKYFNVDKIAAELANKRDNEIYTDLIEARKYAEAREMAEA